MQNRNIKLVVAALLGLLFSVAFTTFFPQDNNRQLVPSQDHAPDSIRRVLRPEPQALEPFTLLDQDNKPFTLKSLQGKWTILFFGYTHCPDICPTALGEMAALFVELDKTPELINKTSGVFLSVDPKRDTPQLLKEYVNYFDSRFFGVTGTAPKLAKFARQLGAGFILQDEDEHGDYLVSHTTSFFIIDPQGQLIGHFRSLTDIDKSVQQLTDLYKYIEGKK